MKENCQASETLHDRPYSAMNMHYCLRQGRKDSEVASEIIRAATPTQGPESRGGVGEQVHSTSVSKGGAKTQCSYEGMAAWHSHRQFIINEYD